MKRSQLTNVAGDGSSDGRPQRVATSNPLPHPHPHPHQHNQHPKHIHYTLSITPTHNIAPLSCLQAGCSSYHPPMHVNKCAGDFIFSFKLTFLTERCTNTQSRFQTKAQINYVTSLQQKQNNDNNTCLTALFPGLPRWAGTRKVKPIWILLKQETVSGSGISSAICKSAPRSRQITTPAPHHSVFYRLDALPAAQPTASKHWRQY